MDKLNGYANTPHGHMVITTVSCGALGMVGLPLAMYVFERFQHFPRPYFDGDGQTGLGIGIMAATGWLLGSLLGMLLGYTRQDSPAARWAQAWRGALIVVAGLVPALILGGLLAMLPILLLEWVLGLLHLP